MGIANHFQLQFLPAQDGFLDKDLADQRGLQPPSGYSPKLLDVIDQSAAGTAHRVGRTQNNRIAELFSNGFGIFNAVCDFASGHLYAQRMHGFFKLNTVFTAFNGIDLDTDDFYAVLLQNAGFIQFSAEV